MAVATAQGQAGTGTAPPGSAARGRWESPHRLWALLVVAVLAVLLAGSVAAVGLSGRESTAEHTDQATEALYSEVQDLSYSLADANATAATALLIGQVTPKTSTDRFGSDITQVEDLLSAASQQVTGDAKASGQLTKLAEQVPEYAQWIGEALADNRFGYPVAGGYLREASTLYTSAMAVEVDTVVSEEQAATQDAMSSASSTDWLTVGICVLALIALTWVSSGIARSTKRRMNPGLLAAKLAVLVLLGWAFVASVGSSTAVSTARGDFNQVVQTQVGAAQSAKAEAYVALQQIARGEDGGTDQSQADSALGALAGVGKSVSSAGATGAAKAVGGDVTALVGCDQSAIAQASGGNYQQAIISTVGQGSNVGLGGCEPDAKNVRTDLLALTQQGQARYDADMASVRSSYAGGGALVLPLALGLLGAVAAAWGINRRLAEYR